MINRSMTLGHFRRLGAARLAGIFMAALMIGAIIGAPASAGGVAAANKTTTAVSLVMVEELGCPYCARWHAEIGEIYPKTAEGRFAPLTTIFIHDKRARRFKRVAYTPTFIVVKNGKEVGRILGYSGEDFFWPMLEQILIKAGYKPAAPATPTQ